MPFHAGYDDVCPAPAPASVVGAVCSGGAIVVGDLSVSCGTADVPLDEVWTDADVEVATLADRSVVGMSILVSAARVVTEMGMLVVVSGPALTTCIVFVTTMVSMTRSVVGSGTKTVRNDVFGGGVSTTVIVTVPPGRSPEPEPEPDPDPPEPSEPPDPSDQASPLMGTTEYVALGARPCGLWGWPPKGKDWQAGMRRAIAERKDVARLNRMSARTGLQDAQATRTANYRYSTSYGTPRSVFPLQPRCDEKIASRKPEA